MYIPKQFQPKNTSIWSFCCKNPFVQVTTFDGDRYFQSNVPALVLEGEDRIQFHLSRSNGHSKILELKTKTLISFMGAHCYVPPFWFEEDNLVPTWNYMTVSASGICDILEPNELKKHIRNLTNHMNFLNDKLHRAIIGFEMKKPQINAKFKLSQNRSKASLIKFVHKLKEQDEDYYKDMILEIQSHIDA
jgi:transcriptional regulator